MKLSTMKGLHWTARRLLERAGYRWEIRRNGDLKLGLLRKTLRERGADRKTAPKRLVLVPGFGDSAFSWLFVLSLLTPVMKRRFDEVVLLDFPGFNGVLVDEKSFHSMDLLLTAVGDVFDSLQPDTILGHSLGGWLSTLYAIDCGKGARPALRKRHGYEGPRQLILVAPGGLHVDAGMRARWEENFRRMFDGDRTVLRPHLFAKEPLWFRLIGDDFARFAEVEGIRQFAESVRVEHFIEKQLESVRASTWLIWGDRDTLVETACAETWLKHLAAGQARTQAVLLKGVGHSPQLEKATVTATVLGQILLGREPHARGARWWRVVEAPAAATAGSY